MNTFRIIGLRGTRLCRGFLLRFRIAGLSGAQLREGIPMTRILMKGLIVPNYISGRNYGQDFASPYSVASKQRIVENDRLIGSESAELIIMNSVDSFFRCHAGLKSVSSSQVSLYI